MNRTVKSLIIPLCIILPCFSSIQAQLNSFENIEQWEKGGFKKSLKGFFSGITSFGDPFQMGGGLNLGLRSYSSSDSIGRQDPFFYTLGANLNFRIYQIDIPFSMIITAKNTESSTPNFREMFNSFKDQLKSRASGFARLGFSPHYKWAKLHIGHRSMNFSKYTLSNLNFLGAGIELNPDKFRVAAMYGRLAKAEPINLSLATPNLPVYRRIGWSTKLGYGNDKASADLIIFTAKDDENSISIPGTYSKQVSPEANFAIGVQLQKLFFEKIRIKLDYTRSGVSPNTSDATSSDKNLTNFLLTKRNSTYYGNAIEGSVALEGKKVNTGISLNRVDNSFRTFGAYFFNRDIMDIQAFANFGLLQNKLSNSLKFGIQSNNLDDSKASTTRRLIYDIQTAWSDKDFNAQFNYSNNSSDVSYILNQQLDSLNAVVVTQDLGANLSYKLPIKGDNTHTVTLTANMQDVSDDIEKPSRISVSKLYLGNLQYAFSTKSKWTIVARTNYTINEIQSTKLNRLGLGASVQKSILKEKLSIGLNTNYYNNSNTAGLKSSNATAQITLGTKLAKVITLQFAYGLLRTNSDSSTTFTENIANLGLQYSFNYKPKGKKSKS